MKHIRQDQLATAKEELKEAVVREQYYSIFDLGWDTAFRSVKRRLATNDWQHIADVTKKALSELGTEERSRRYKEKHREYINSELWRLRSKNFLKSKNWTCEDCGEKASEAHHTRYENLGAEHVDDEFQDLVALCSECHKRRHYERGDFYE